MPSPIGTTNSPKLKLAPTIQEEICNRLRAGAYFKIAVLAAGISQATAYEWLSRGRDYKAYHAEHGSKPDPDDQIFIDFAEAVEEAGAKAEMTALAKLRQGEVGWQAQAWFLERRYPERWRRRDSIETTDTPVDRNDPMTEIRAALDEKDVAALESELRYALLAADENRDS